MILNLMYNDVYVKKDYIFKKMSSSPEPEPRPQIWKMVSITIMYLTCFTIPTIWIIVAKVNTFSIFVFISFLVSLLTSVSILVRSLNNQVNIEDEGIRNIQIFFWEDFGSGLFCYLLALGVLFFCVQRVTNITTESSTFAIGVIGISVGLGGIAVSVSNFIFDTFKVFTGNFENQRRLGIVGSTLIGIIERLFFSIATVFNMPGLLAAMVGWIALKGVNIWLKSYEPNPDNDLNIASKNSVRLKHAAFINLISFLFALLGGLYASIPLMTHSPLKSLTIIQDIFDPILYVLRLK
ncbi:MAG: hypothetical protein AB4060_23070 [Crocosphaera sp.]